MKTDLRWWLCFWLLISGVLFLHAEPVAPDGFIRRKGAYQFSNAGSSVEVITAPDGKPSLVMDFRSKGPNSTNSVKTSFDQEGILRGDGWFVFVETERKLWIFDGIHSLSTAEEKNNAVLIKDFDGESARLCPKPVKDALPQGVRDSLFKKRL